MLMKPKIGAVIQARIGSTRLRGKVLLPLPYGSGISVIENIISRIKRSRRLDEIIIATTTNKADDSIAALAKKLKVKCFRGSADDVLSRFYGAALKYHLNVIVRLTADNPCVDYQLIDATVKGLLSGKYDYFATSNFPLGLNVEAFSFVALERAQKNASKDFEREHVTPYIYHSDRSHYKIGHLKAPYSLARPDIRATLDTEEDYAFMCAVFDHLYPKNRTFSTKEIVRLCSEKPWLTLINRKIVQNKFKGD